MIIARTFAVIVMLAASFTGNLEIDAQMFRARFSYSPDVIGKIVSNIAPSVTRFLTDSQKTQA